MHPHIHKHTRKFSLTLSLTYTHSHSLSHTLTQTAPAYAVYTEEETVVLSAIRAHAIESVYVGDVRVEITVVPQKVDSTRAGKCV
jgi:predicted glycoside hydrolase/deacetylase ChbG (UPF0249 family)